MQRCLPLVLSSFSHSLPLKWVQATHLQALNSLLLVWPHSWHETDIYKETKIELKHYKEIARRMIEIMIIVKKKIIIITTSILYMNQKLRSSSRTQSITTARVPVTSSFGNENVVHALKPLGVDRKLESPLQAHSEK